MKNFYKGNSEQKNIPVVYSLKIGETIKNAKINAIINPILCSLGALEYKNEILLQNNKISVQKKRFAFVIRLKSLIFYILKKNNFPVVINDVSQLRRDQINILRFSFINFKYEKVSIVYIRNLYRRIKLQIEKKSFFNFLHLSNDTFEKISKTTKYSENIISEMFKDNFSSYLYKKFDLSTFGSYRQILKLIEENKKNF